MFGLIRFAFYVFVAVASGIVAASVPFGGKTVAERVSVWWSTPTVQRAVSEAGDRVRRGVEAAAQSPSAPRAPKETHDAKAKAAVERLVAGRAPRGR